MAPERPVLLLTRPAPQAARFAATAREWFGAGLRIVQSPLMATEYLAPDLPLEGAAGLVITSESGVEGLARLTDRRDLPAHCVGAATARAARAAGLAVATIGSGDATGLAAALRGVADPLLWPRGAEVAVDLAALLARHGVAVNEVVVYRQAPQAPTGDATAAMAGPAPVILPLFSPRSARLAADAWPSRGAPLYVAAMSAAVAKAAAGLAPDRLIVAARPEAPAMLEAIAALIDASHAA